MIIDISHRLSFPAGAARMVEHLLLSPLSGPTQTVREWSIDMPGIEAAARFIDAYGNRALLVSQAKLEGEVVITITGKVETIDRNGVLGRIAGEPVVGLFRRVTSLTEPDPALLELFKDADRHGAARIGLFHAVMERLGELYIFAGASGFSETPAALAQSQSMGGMTQSQGGSAEAEEPDDREPADAPAFAHAFVATVRALGIPARYVTGYLLGGDGPAAFHAWAEAYDEGLGWIAFDAALGVCPTDRHVRVATGLDMFSTLPLRIVPQLAAMPTEAILVDAGQ